MCIRDSPNRSKLIYKLLQDRELDVKYYSKFKNLDCRFLILDSFGKMEQFFNISDIVFLGGSLLKKGGHNPIEAATANCAIITGSNVFNWQNLYEDMVEKDACIMVNEVKEFETKVINLIENKNLVENLKRNALTFSNTVFFKEDKLLELLNNRLGGNA